MHTSIFNLSCEKHSFQNAVLSLKTQHHSSVISQTETGRGKRGKRIVGFQETGKKIQTSCNQNTLVREENLKGLKLIFSPKFNTPEISSEIHMEKEI